jgi:hypothetical protein
MILKAVSYQFNIELLANGTEEHIFLDLYKSFKNSY